MWVFILPFCNEIGCRIFAYENYERVELTNCCECLTVEQVKVRKTTLTYVQFGGIASLPQLLSAPAYTGQRFSCCLLCAMFSLGRGDERWGRGEGWLIQVPTGPENKLPSSYRQRFSGCLLCAMFSLGRGMRGGRGGRMTQSGAYWTWKQAPQLIQAEI